MSWLNDEAYMNIEYIVVTPEVSHAPMSSLKDAAAALQSMHQQSGYSSKLSLQKQSSPQNNHDMSVTPPVSHVEMWPYVASAAAGSASHAANAARMLSLSSAMPSTAGNKLARHKNAAAT